MTKNLYEAIVALVLVVLAVLLLNPLHFWMPDMLVYSLLTAVVAVFALFAGFVVRERAADERDMQHRSLSGRVAFLVGAAIITLGIIEQSLMYTVDPWLVFALVGMILAKLISRMYADHRC